MEQLQNLTLQKWVVFFFCVLFIIFQTCFLVQGTNYFLILPSLFLILTYKPKLMGYGDCFVLGLINDIFAMQTLGLSSIMFVVLKFIKATHITRSHKSYADLLIEYCIYCIGLFVITFVLMLIMGLISLNIMFVFSILLLLLGFFIADYLWLKIFGLFNKQ